MGLTQASIQTIASLNTLFIEQHKTNAIPLDLNTAKSTSLLYEEPILPGAAVHILTAGSLIPPIST